MSQMEYIEEAVRLGMGVLNPEKALIVDTGKYTGRAVNRRFIVSYSVLKDSIDWGKVNRPIDSETASKLFSRVENKIKKRKHYNFEAYAGFFPLKLSSTSPWHIAFAQNMFRSAPVKELAGKAMDKKIEVFHDPFAKASDYLGGEEEAIIVLDPLHLKIVVLGTSYAGEIKKGAFTICNYILPEMGYFSMHASANCLPDGTNSCVLFGLSGTGKTTLSAAPDRNLIGDDEILWTDAGLSNLEGGCYAKLIRLTEKSEPEIYHACNRPGAILENVVYDPEKKSVDFFDSRKTENTRGSYSLYNMDHIYTQEKESEAPSTIIFLTADAFGALPAVAKLDFYQTQYHFVLGYTARVAGTELGVKEPQAAFSACFGAPFMPRSSMTYAGMLAERVEDTGASVWLLNTGWTGGAYGKGERFPLEVTRKILRAIQSGELNTVECGTHPIFGFGVPKTCPGVEEKYLSIPEGKHVQDLAEKFIQEVKENNIGLSQEVIARGGPQIPRTQDSSFLREDKKKD